MNLNKELWNRDIILLKAGDESWINVYIEPLI